RHVGQLVLGRPVLDEPTGQVIDEFLDLLVGPGILPLVGVQAVPSAATEDLPHGAGVPEDQLANRFGWHRDPLILGRHIEVTQRTDMITSRTSPIRMRQESVGPARSPERIAASTFCMTRFEDSSFFSPLRWGRCEP